MAFNQEQELSPAQQRRIAGLETAMQYHEWILAMDGEEDSADKVPAISVVIQTATAFEKFIENGS